MRSGWGITGSVKESPSGRVLGDMEPTVCVCLCWEEEQQCQADKKAQEPAQRLFIGESGELTGAENTRPFVEMTIS
jgi:hypothetical protein